MSQRHWVLSILFGIAVGFLVGAVMTFLDWRLNPGGIFHSDSGTSWTVVWDTWFSWFAPLSVIVAGISAAFLYWRAKRR